MRDHRALRVWHLAHATVVLTFDLGSKHWKPLLAVPFRQLQSAALSVQLNIAEGYALASWRQFARHLRIAYGSAVEVGDLVEVLAETSLVPAELVDRMGEQNRQCRAMLLKLIKRLNQREIQGGNGG